MRILSIDSRTVGVTGRKFVRFGANMSGVIVAMRRTLLSCTSLARLGAVTLVAAAVVSVKPAKADESSVIDVLSGYLDLNRQAA